MENKTKENVMVLQNAIDRAIQRGCFNIHETNDILEAIKYLNSLPNVEFGEIETVENEQANRS